MYFTGPVLFHCIFVQYHVRRFDDHLSMLKFCLGTFIQAEFHSYFITKGFDSLKEHLQLNIIFHIDYQIFHVKRVIYPSIGTYIAISSVNQ